MGKIFQIADAIVFQFAFTQDINADGYVLHALVAPRRRNDYFLHRKLLFFCKDRLSADGAQSRNGQH